MPIRKAGEGDIESIARLAALKRRQYEKYQPVFHRENPNAMENHKAYLRDSFPKDHTIFLVSETDQGIDGFVVGAILNPPPVYNPGGKICLVDDYMVETPDLWATVGRNLLDEVRKLAMEKGAVLMNVVCGPLDEDKKALLAEEAYAIASEWHVKTIV